MPEIRSTVGGLRAIALMFRPIRDIASGRSICFLTRTHLNTPGLGTLMPETFRPAAEFSGRSKDLFSLELLQLGEVITVLDESDRVFEWVSLDMPLSVLLDKEVLKLLEQVCDKFSLTPNKFCFVIPERVLEEKESTAAENIARLRRHGYHIMLSGFGDSGCPFISLSELSVDYVMLSPSLTGQLRKTERGDLAIHSIISFVNELGCDPVADGVENSTQAEAFYELGCNYCAGPLSGEYISLSELIE